MRKLRYGGVLAVVLLLIGVNQASAAGFALIEQSVKGLGTAFAGGAAVAEDPSTVYFNPAGMVRLEGTQATGGIHMVAPSTKFKKGTATNVAGTNLTGGNGGQGGRIGVVPNTYLTHALSDSWWLGLGVNAPFGLATDYNRDWVGRYHAVESDLRTVNFNPSVAYKVNDQFSIGAGVNVQYIHAYLTSMIDAGMLVTSIPANSQTADVYSEMKGDDWGFGYNVGLLYALNKDTRIGASYRSGVSQDLKGRMVFSSTNVTSAGYIGAGLFPSQEISAQVDLPASAQVSVYHQATDHLALMADVMWTRWNSFDKLVVKFDQGILAGAVTQTVTTEEWHNNMRYSLGAVYQVTDACVLRAGVAYDETPIPDAHRTPRIPGTDRTWVAIGAGHQIGALSLDVAYAHLFVPNSKIRQTIATPVPTDENFSRGNLVGKFENGVDIISAEMTYKF